MCFGKKSYGILKTYTLFHHNELSSLPYVAHTHAHAHAHARAHTHVEGTVVIGQETRQRSMKGEKGGSEERQL